MTVTVAVWCVLVWFQFSFTFYQLAPGHTLSWYLGMQTNKGTLLVLFLQEQVSDDKPGVKGAVAS